MAGGERSQCLCPRPHASILQVRASVKGDGAVCREEGERCLLAPTVAIVLGGQTDSMLECAQRRIFLP